ncbi:hypothetical protein [Sphingobacterium sp. SGL-16]|jgi:hypothetical protein|uniref:hypothetical protein n=1 Tax=Sphingobacterium sp. SGL-16 TaxID=2710883 RepID=UPI0013EBF50A|nr:hypothetical protein [Sphingobacterium sp. SGL-16]NGM74675.1 hypothetical protein [Sphingobacterium sp. SGL-16]
MKRIYHKPTAQVHDIFIEECIANASSTLRVGSMEEDVMEEWEIGADDKRYFEW